MDGLTSWPSMNKKKEICFLLLIWDCFPASAALRGEGWRFWRGRGTATGHESEVGQAGSQDDLM